jgi:hypothetical protein
MTHRATGLFDAKLAPQPLENQPEGSGLGRMSLDKTFHGDLEGVSQGQMLTAGAPGGSAVYVAIEKVIGTLGGKRGSFVLVHQGVMTKDRRELVVTVAPDSGTDELVGLAGTLAIEIKDDEHRYIFDYIL